MRRVINSILLGLIKLNNKVLKYLFFLSEGVIFSPVEPGYPGLVPVSDGYIAKGSGGGPSGVLCGKGDAKSLGHHLLGNQVGVCVSIRQRDVVVMEKLCQLII